MKPQKTERKQFISSRYFPFYRLVLSLSVVVQWWLPFFFLSFLCAFFSFFSFFSFL